MYENNEFENTNVEIEAEDGNKRASGILEGSQDLASVKMAETVNKQEKYDLVTSLLKAAEFKNDEDFIKEVSIKRNNVYYFTVRIHPISDQEISFARKKGTIKKKKGESELDSSIFNSWLIYLATVEEDRKEIWGNREFKNKYGLAANYESIDILLTAGEKADLVLLVYEISGMNDDQNTLEDPEEEAKNL